MARFISLRTHEVGGAVQQPFVVDWQGGNAYQPVTEAEVARDVSSREVILGVHGFNVSRGHGAGSLAALETSLALGAHQRFFGVLWPGDFWLPVVSYSWEAATAVKSGRYLAEFINRVMTSATSVSLVSHSLGARVVLEAITAMGRPARETCLTAPAVDRSCLKKQYAAALDASARITVLSSVKDKVLKLAYPAGDFISDVFLGDNDSPWDSALGLRGPPPPVLSPVVGEAIPGDGGFDHKGFDHSDYFPPSAPVAGGPADPKWAHSAAFIGRAIRGEPATWS